MIGLPAPVALDFTTWFRHSMKPLLHQLYEKYLSDDDCPSFIKSVSQSYLVGTIERLTTASSQMVRRASVLALGFLADYESNHRLGKVLQDPDTTVRSMAEHAIQQLWFRTGTDTQQKELLVIERLNLSNQFEKAIVRASCLITANPSIDEAWNQRAIAKFNLLRFTDSIKDCHQALELNPYHYPAAIGMGHSFLEIGDNFNAIDCFHRALNLNPGLNFVRAQINFLKKSLN